LIDMKGKIITLCGCTDFKDEYERVNRELTLQGNVVLSCGVFRYDFPDIEKHRPLLEEVHKRKIDLCEAVLIINVGGYIGEHTKEEIEYAESKGKNVLYLEDEDGTKIV
jgi:hypothetical protein